MLARPVLVVALGASALLGACGGGEDRVALAVDEARRTGDVVVVSTECADEVRAELRPDPQGSGLVQVSLWGRPQVGRCQPTTTIEVPVDQTKLVDAATGQVVDIEPG